MNESAVIGFANHIVALEAKIAKLKSALLPFAKEFEIGDASGELQHWPASEVARCRAVWEALK